ncbi:hypothetical protein [Thermodesulfitimonas sp.]
MRRIRLLLNTYLLLIVLGPQGAACVTRALKAGAAAYLPAGLAPVEIRQAVRLIWEAAVSFFPATLLPLSCCCC